MANFLGIKQVTKSYFDTYEGSKLGYLWLVRETDSEGNTINPEVWFGTRKYASEKNDFIKNLQTTFGGLLDANGEFVFPIGENVDDFKTIDESKIDNIYDLLVALDGAISNKVEETVYNNKVTELQEAIGKCLSGVNVVVNGEKYTGSVENGVVTVDLTNAFVTTGKIQDVQVDNVTVVDENGVANISISGKADSSVVTALADSVAKLEGLTHASDVVYLDNFIYLLVYSVFI